jgi:hypothetical protein
VRQEPRLDFFVPRNAKRGCHRGLGAPTAQHREAGSASRARYAFPDVSPCVPNERAVRAAGE